MVRSAGVLAALAAWPRSTADMYDVLMPHYLPPAECGAAGCAAWSGQDPRVWRAGAAPGTLERPSPDEAETCGAEGARHGGGVPQCPVPQDLFRFI